MRLPLTGGCNCGAITFEVTAPLVGASYCHCKRCQRRSGTAASASAHPAPGSFHIVSGQDKLRVWKPRDGGEKWFAVNADRRSTATTRATAMRSASGATGYRAGPRVVTPVPVLDQPYRAQRDCAPVRPQPFGLRRPVRGRQICPGSEAAIELAGPSRARPESPI